MGTVWVGMVQPAPMVGFTHTCTTNLWVSATLQVPINLYGYFTFFHFDMDLFCIFVF